MDLDLRVVRYFAAVADAGTYAAAAASLHVATPSLSQQIRRFEATLGVRLLERDHRGARLTPVGAEILDAARPLLADQERVLGVVRRHRRAAGHTLRVGFLSGGAGPLTRRLLDALHARVPEAVVDLVQVGWGEQVSAVLDGSVDAVFARPPLADAPVRRVPLLSERRVLVMAAGHRLAGRSSLGVADLADVVQIDTEGVDEEWRRWWSLDPRPDGTRPRYGPVVRTMEELLQVVATTDAVAVTAESMHELYPRPDVCYRPILDAEPTTVELVVARGPHSPLVGHLLQVAAPLRGGLTATRARPAQVDVGLDVVTGTQYVPSRTIMFPVRDRWFVRPPRRRGAAATVPRADARSPR